MKNPILPIAFGFIAGTAIGFAFSSLLLPVTILLILCAAIGIGFSSRYKLNIRRYSLLALAISVAFFMGGLNAFLSHPAKENLSSFPTAQNQTLKVITTSPSSSTKNGYRTEVQLLEDSGKKLNTKCLLYSKLADGKLPLGTELSVSGSLQAVEGPDFFLQFCSRKGIDLILRAEQLEILGREKSVFTVANDLQSSFSALFREHLDDDAAGLMSALILGEKNGLEQSDKQAFAASGLSHVLAISGMHVGIIFTLLIGLIKPTILYRRGSGWVNMFLIVLLWAYAMICGLSPAVVRAVILLSLFLLSESLNWQIRKINLLAFAAMAMLFFVPEWVMDAGFQLSFCATAGILWAAKPLEKAIQDRFSKIPAQIASGLAVSLVAQAFTLPLILVHFGQFPTYFLLSNLLIAFPALWTVRLGFLSLALLWVPGLNTILGFLMDALAHFLSLIPSLISKIPFHTAHSASFSDGGFVSLVIMALGGTLIWFMPSIRIWWVNRQIAGMAGTTETKGFHLAAGLFLLCFVVDLIG